MKKILVSSIFICALCLWGADEVFTVTGTGSSPKIAIREALISALEQKCGVTISASERSLLSSEENFQTENVANVLTFSINGIIILNIPS